MPSGNLRVSKFNFGCCATNVKPSPNYRVSTNPRRHRVLTDGLDRQQAPASRSDRSDKERSETQCVPEMRGRRACGLSGGRV